ncbi:hypothetical protein D3C78_716470 [compost metagenome]
MIIAGAQPALIDIILEQFFIISNSLNHIRIGEADFFCCALGVPIRILHVNLIDEELVDPETHMKNIFASDYER